MKALFIGVVGCLGLIACKKQAADLDPTVRSFTVNGESLAIEANAGDVLAIDLTVEDENELNQWRVAIEDSLGNNSLNTYAYYHIEAIGGSAYTDLFQITIDSTATAGLYTIKAEAMDATGNSSDPASIQMVLAHPDQPVINITAPTFSNPYLMNAGDTIYLEGNVVGTTNLSAVKASINSGVLYSVNYSVSDTDQFNLNTFALDGNPITFSDTTEAGLYEFILQAYDEYGHITRQQFWLQVQ